MTKLYRTWAIVRENGALFINTNRKATNHTTTRQHAKYLAEASRESGHPVPRVVRVEIREVEQGR